MGRTDRLLGWMAVCVACGLTGCGAKEPAELAEAADASAGPDAAPMRVSPPDAAPMPRPPQDAAPDAADSTPPPDAAPVPSPPPDAPDASAPQDAADASAPPDAADASPPPDAAPMPVRPSPPDVADDPAGVQCLEVEGLSPAASSPVEPECTLPVPMEGSAGEIVDPDTGEVVEAWGQSIRVGDDGRPFAFVQWRHIRNGIGNWSVSDGVFYCRHDAADRVDLMGDVVEERCEFGQCELTQSGELTLYVRDAEGRIVRIVGRELSNDGEEFVTEYFWDDTSRLVFVLGRTCSPRRVLSAEEVGPCTDEWFRRLTWGADGELSMVESGGYAPYGPLTGILLREVRPGGCPAP
jgi:hypothetical protein